MPIEINNQKHYDLGEVAELLRVSYPTVKNYRKRGWLQGTRSGRRVLVTEEEIQRFLKEGTDAPAQNDNKKTGGE